MIVYKYGNYVSSDKEILEERISEDIACHIKGIGTVEAIAEDKYNDIEEIEMSQAEYKSHKGRL